MKIKGLILFAIFVSVAALSVSQSNVVLAQVGPATSPVTSPVTYYTYHLTGRIVYRLLDHIFPAPLAKVVAKNTQTNETFIAQPDTYGYYNLTVTQSSPSVIYKIKAVDNLGTTWSPREAIIVVSEDKTHLNFVGTR